ncbi:MAG: hypothetical protein ACUVWN_11540 [bacterium]
MEKIYESPRVLETMPIEDILMDEELAPEWVNWDNSWNNWKQNWNNKSVAIPKTLNKSKERSEEH